MKILAALSLFLVVLYASFLSKPKENEYDVVVYGGTSSGVIAAYAAAKEGLSVVILEPNKHLGGLTTSGLGHVDIGNHETVGGYAMEFLKRVGVHYGMKRFCTEMESSAAEKVFLEMTKEAGVTVFYQSRLREKNGVVKKNNKIEKVSLENGKTYTAKVFIDATYEGDLMAGAKIPYTVGRESNKKYGESSAGIQKYSQSGVLSNARLEEIKELSATFPLDYIFANKAEKGSADNKVQAYTYRLSLSTDKNNQVPFTKPKNYHPKRYHDNLVRIYKSKLIQFDKVVTVYPMPNNKTDINHLDVINASWNYPDGSYKERDYIANYHKEYEQGYLYFLANDENVPEALRKDASRYGYSKDEFADNGNWPYLLYVREGRRMLGNYVMVQQDAWSNINKVDGIGMGSYFMDCHTVQQIITPDGRAMQEGEMEHAPFRPYEISYNSLVPKISDCENLFVTVCMSASHTIYGSLRMEPVFMITGQAAGVAAAMAVNTKKAVQQIDIPQLREKLLAQKQILSHQTKPGFFITKESTQGYVMDDTDAVVKGTWLHSISSAPFLMYNYQFVAQTPKETASAVYQPKLPEDGNYEVQLMYSADTNRSKKARIVITDDEGEKEVWVDMSKKNTAANPWHSLGEFKFSKQKQPKVTISNKGDGGIVVADGLRFNKI
ncbi:FAD-dependent oxidoreductase [Pedobacter xixiisoli]|uniref:FAD dependent oxidoreductase n=1 Tax=Pedobacter xixiisoli TaxID=1476464 RepID=A0A285ZSA4_9SPHI|nr:FAD-dependent oxidoreductase [Pedobacter xixiisoli]SOD12521.1 FAD dependent oxidoreductase [Pedobacter xixiisoli]